MSEHALASHFFFGSFACFRFGPGPAPSPREYRPDKGGAEVIFAFGFTRAFDDPPDTFCFFAMTTSFLETLIYKNPSLHSTIIIQTDLTELTRRRDKVVRSNRRCETRRLNRSTSRIPAPFSTGAPSYNFDNRSRSMPRPSPHDS